MKLFYKIQNNLIVTQLLLKRHKLFIQLKTAFNMILMLFLKVLNFSKIWGFDKHFGKQVPYVGQSVEKKQTWAWVVCSV